MVLAGTSNQTVKAAIGNNQTNAPEGVKQRSPISDAVTDRFNAVANTAFVDSNGDWSTNRIEKPEL